MAFYILLSFDVLFSGGYEVCITMAAGKNASIDGSIMIAYSADALQGLRLVLL